MDKEDTPQVSTGETPNEPVPQGSNASDDKTKEDSAKSDASDEQSKGDSTKTEIPSETKKPVERKNFDWASKWGNDRDLAKYRSHYPGQKDTSTSNTNFMFYSGEIRSQPSGDYIQEIHSKWWGNTPLLEAHHGYIQWLFPIREHGMNSQSYPLQLVELEKMKNSELCMKNLIKSYEFMLHFYGCQIKDKETGELERHEGWRKQYDNLNSHSHNNLRITRILKCLGEFGYEHYKAPFLRHFIKEIYEELELDGCQSSLEQYWVGTIRDDDQRYELMETIDRLRAAMPPKKSYYSPWSSSGSSYSKPSQSSAGKSSVVVKKLSKEDEEAAELLKQKIEKAMLDSDSEDDDNDDEEEDEDGEEKLKLKDDGVETKAEAQEKKEEKPQD